MKNSNPKILVGMSGGVDSSVAAALLLEKGYDVTGVFIKFWSEGSSNLNKCCSLEAYQDARRVASKLKIKLYTWDMKSIFKSHVVDDFLAQYSLGRTPNPCVLCNKYIKFGEFLSRAKKLGFEFIATGHHVNVKKARKQSLDAARDRKNKKTIYNLTTAKDKDKDQSYFLWTLTQPQLKHVLFPVGNYTKTEIRNIAKKKNLPVFNKKDSQGLCFIKDKRHYDFLRRHLKLKKGPIKTSDGIPEKGIKPGTKIGEHQGLPLYTIGQRREILVGGIGPFYVVKCNYNNNTLYVANKFDRKLLYRKELVANKVSWISGKTSELPLKCKVKIRYGHPAVPATLKKSQPRAGQPLAEKNHKIKVEFTKSQRAITSGQSVVFYSGTEVLGGGVIQ